MNRLRIAVLGGTGFVGHSLCALLAKAGHEVRVLTRRRERHRDFLVLPTAQVVEADVHSAVELRREFEGMDAVVNLVGILHETRRDSFDRAHVELPARVIQACRSARVPRLLHMSALPASEAGPSRYLLTKGHGERLVLEANGPDLHVTVFRPSVIFGPRDQFTNRFAGLLRQVPWVFPLACARSRIQPVYVEDVARAFSIALGRGDTFGLGEPRRAVDGHGDQLGRRQHGQHIEDLAFFVDDPHHGGVFIFATQGAVQSQAFVGH